MSLFIRLSIVAAIAVLLRCVPATVVITAPSTVTNSTAKTLRQPLTCPTAPDYSILGNTTQVAGKEYLHTTLLESRLKLSDVLARVVSGPEGHTRRVCALAAYSEGLNAFSFVRGECKVYQFEKNFCPCAPGDFDIYINPKLLGASKALPSEKVAEGVEKMVIYSELYLAHHILTPKRIPYAKDASECAANLAGSLTNSATSFLIDRSCYLSKHHDFAGCNQTCRGRPFNIFVKRGKVPIPEQPILSLCGQKIVVPMIDDGRFIHTYFSHAGFGCYRYPRAETAGEKDCIVTFEKDIKTVSLQIDISTIQLNSVDDTCDDWLNIYDGNTTADASIKVGGCNHMMSGESFTFKGAITIKFHRELDSEYNIGFKLQIRNYNY